MAELPSDEAYFEVGVLKGGTLISGLLDHKFVTAYANDKWCEYLDENPEQTFRDNLLRYKDRLPDVKVLKGDSFELAKNAPFEKPIGLYFYDGDHSEEAQRRALTDFSKYLAKKCIVLVDDWNWDKVRTGTWKGIDALRPQNVYYVELPSRKNGDLENYHNGIGAFYLELGESKLLTVSK
jgi:hypothetical protein